ncbi:MAG: Holliday junction resolvase RuvX [Deltaproteobacteria bacterium]|jgi:putative Holliday junction resolvase|nr:Holliday junction resolvase RuvX [Deltaproteobacteria bacterium]MCL5880899.1 Holliday junction resolvase RuvX [Deltaproteobacteria bacterium]MDA8303719.1 Holliday junction resolvase RuvX [Deltaproteobacteria bacterium]
MSNKKALGIDYGLKRIGLSLSDDTQTIAFPFKYIPNTSLKEIIAKLEEIISNENIGLIVIGMPLGLKGKQTDLSLKINEFAKELAFAHSLCKTKNPIPIVIYDERFSTVQAQKSLISQNVKRKKRKEIVDSVASTFILQSYLDKNKKNDKNL